MASFCMDDGRRQPKNTSGDRFRHLRYMLTTSQGFPLKTVAADRRGAPSARLTSRPEPLALRMSYYGSRAPSQAISGLGVSVKFRVMWSGLSPGQLPEVKSCSCDAAWQWIAVVCSASTAGLRCPKVGSTLLPRCGVSESCESGRASRRDASPLSVCESR